MPSSSRASRLQDRNCNCNSKISSALLHRVHSWYPPVWSLTARFTASISSSSASSDLSAVVSCLLFYLFALYLFYFLRLPLGRLCHWRMTRTISTHLKRPQEWPLSALGFRPHNTANIRHDRFPPSPNRNHDPSHSVIQDSHDWVVLTSTVSDAS